ncbi:hypothetical protein BV898_13315 [Hypsibius exemplaris]|uniref:G-protein coupled receptors family 1 profile domain-containing protein n=1 Tax=Hypsibius exemplaris TaxID=2072580 RepID=A0A1W0WB46_HYPEX|nr:hypothetical protein BV898_13315 [Hypsibius exemplaris]
MDAQLPPILISTTMIATQTFNLIIFSLWRHKEPYIFLHICLAVASLLAGLSGATTAPLRYATHTPFITFLNQSLATALIFYATSASILANFAISVDRWLSVEFAIKYRNSITKQKAVVAGLISTFVVPLLLSVPRFAVYWQDLIWLPCTGDKHFSPKGSWAEISEVMMGPMFLPLLFVSQLRILMIATRQKYDTFSSLDDLRLVTYFTFIQHYISPVIYGLFWNNYRIAVHRLFRRLRAVLTPNTIVGAHPS